MFRQDELTIEILPDGTIKTTTSRVSGANHSNAEQFLQHVAKLAGGDTERVRRADALHNHVHDHAHEHNHS